MKYFVLVLFSLSYGQIYISSPRDLYDKFDGGEVKGLLGNFGNPPYDTSIVGTLWYSEDNELACEKYYSTHPDYFNSLIVMADRGDCSYALKVKNAQNIGAKSLIIVNNIKDQNIDNVPMSDSGEGGNLFIPAFLISYEDGEKIKEALKTKTVALVLDFNMPTTGDFISIDLWIVPDNKMRTAKFIEEFSDIGNSLTKLTADFKPHYKFSNCLYCQSNNYSGEHPDCLGGGRYCSDDPDGSGVLSGRSVVEESLRQICMFKQIDSDDDYKRWFSFQQKFLEDCGLNDFNKKCSEKVMKSLGFKIKDIDDCYEKSFVGGVSYINDNTLLREEKEFWDANGLSYTPALIINGQLFKGDTEYKAFLTGVCAGYSIKNQPSFCKDNSGRQHHGIRTSTVVIILVSFFTVIVALLLAYRHFTKKSIERELKVKVNDAVKQYFALSDASTFKKNDSQVVKGTFI